MLRHISQSFASSKDLSCGNICDLAMECRCALSIEEMRANLLNERM